MHYYRAAILCFRVYIYIYRKFIGFIRVVVRQQSRIPVQRSFPRGEGEIRFNTVYLSLDGNFPLYERFENKVLGHFGRMIPRRHGPRFRKASVS